MTQIELVDELERRMWSRDPELAGACQDLLVEIRRRFRNSVDWHRAYASCLDGIREIRCMPGRGIDGCAEPRAIRTVVETLVRECPVTWEHGWQGRGK